MTTPKNITLVWLLLFLNICPRTATAQEQRVFIAASPNHRNTLCSSDLVNCSIYAIDSIPPLRDIAFTPDGRLWGIKSNRTANYSLYQIDTATAQTTYIGDIDLYHHSVGSLEGLNNTTLLMESEGDLYRIRNTDASIDLIGNVSRFIENYPEGGMLGITWYLDDLYMASPRGMLIKVTFNPTFDHIEKAALVNPDRPIPHCLGLTTVLLPDTGLSMVSLSYSMSSQDSFKGGEVYKINPEDGSYEQLCAPMVVNGNTSGIASISQYPKVAIHEASTADIKPDLYPNPTRDKVTISLAGLQENPSHINIQLYDYTGRLLQQQNMKTPATTLDLSNYAPGIYFIRLRHGDKDIGGGKIVKQ